VVKVNSFPKIEKAIALTIGVTIMTMTIIPSFGIIGNVAPLVYGQTLETETDNINTTGNITATNTTNANVSEVVIPRGPVAHQYIVILKENATFTPQVANETISALSEGLATIGVNVTEFPEVGQLVIDINQTQADQPGIARDLTEQEILDGLENHPNVEDVEQVQEYTIQSQTIPTGIDRSGADKSSTLPGDGQGNVSGVTVAIIDTGIDLDHPDLNVIMNETFVAGTPNGDDDHGHGTHVAGIVAAKDNSEGVVGVAPGANLVALKVLDSNGRGTTTDIIAAINWVAENAHLIDIVNMSLGGGDSRAMNLAIDDIHARGVTIVVAAGNEHINAERTSPANSPDAITVSAIADSDGKCGARGPATSRGPDDSFAAYSNWGRVVDIAAPGTNINSTFSNGQYKVSTGTSMAAPHVAGAAALVVLEERKRTGDDPLPAQIRDTIINSAILDAPVAQCIEDRGYFSTEMDEDSSFERLLFVTPLSPPPRGTTIEITPIQTTSPQPTRPETTQAQRYILEAIDTRNPGSVFTVEVNSLGELQAEMNRLVQGEYDNSENVTTTSADLSFNSTALVNTVDQAIDSIANLQRTFAAGSAEATLANIADGNICFDIGWFRICVYQ
jgi:subtilisin family serine protease